MKLLILCVDGLDPDLASEFGFPEMTHQRRLTIPKSLYVDDPDGWVPHTVLVWPSIFAGREVVPERRNRKPCLHQIRLPVRRWLHSHGIRWRRKKEDRYPYKPCIPIYDDLDTVFSHHSSLVWGVPTLCPEAVCGGPTVEGMIRYSERMYRIWKILTSSIVFLPQELGAAYTNLPDWRGHVNLNPESLRPLYYDLHRHVTWLRERGDVMLVSDHGCLGGRHTDHAYLGCTEPVAASSVIEVRRDIDRLVGLPPPPKGGCEGGDEGHA